MTEAFYDDRGKQQQWRALLRKTGASGVGTLADVVLEINGFLSQPLEIAAQRKPWTAHWASGGPWVQPQLA